MSRAVFKESVPVLESPAPITSKHAVLRLIAAALCSSSGLKRLAETCADITHLETGLELTIYDSALS